MSENADEFIPTRESLLHRLKDWGDQDSWNDFFETYWQLIYRICRQAGLSDAEAQDTVQETVISVARKVEGFNYDPAKGSFKAWLKKLTHWRVIDHLRKKQYEKNGQKYPKETPLPESLLEERAGPENFDIEASWDAEWERHILDLALQKIRLQVSPTQFQLFFLHVTKDLPAKTVAERLGVKLSEVYSAKYKITELIKKEVKALEKRME